MVTITSAALGRKRTRAVARAWPALARGLGADFARLFTAYARAETPPDAGALADGLAFSRTLAREQHLPDSALIERMLATTRLKLRRNRLARRGPRLAAAITAPPRRLVIIISLPPIGARFLILSPPGRRALSLPARDAYVPQLRPVS